MATDEVRPCERQGEQLSSLDSFISGDRWLITEVRLHFRRGAAWVGRCGWTMTWVRVAPVWRFLDREVIGLSADDCVTKAIALEESADREWAMGGSEVT